MVVRNEVEDAPVPAKSHTFGAPATRQQVQGVFRMLFASDSSLIELFHRQAIVGMRDLAELNRKLSEKLARNSVTTTTFRALVRFENGQAREYGEWDKFAGADWAVPCVTDSVSVTWRFLLGDVPGNGAPPRLHTLNILIASSFKPYSVMQAVFSKDPEDVERLEIMAMPMTCRIDFQDHVVSQEVLALVSEWNRGLGEPQGILPALMWCKRHSHRISAWLSRSMPVFAGFALYAYYGQQFAALATPTGPATAALLGFTAKWVACFAALVLASFLVGEAVGSAVGRNLDRFGRFAVLQITNGDQKRQTELLARNTRSVWVFVLNGLGAVLWNVVAAGLCYWFRRT